MEAVPSEVSEPTPFERFRDLTRKLIKVPKEELNQRLEEEKQRKSTPVVDGKTAPQGG